MVNMGPCHGYTAQQRAGSSYKSDFALDTITASESAPTPPPPMQATAAGTCTWDRGAESILEPRGGENEIEKAQKHEKVCSSQRRCCICGVISGAS